MNPMQPTESNTPPLANPLQQLQDEFASPNAAQQEPQPDAGTGAPPQQPPSVALPGVQGTPSQPAGASPYGTPQPNAGAPSPATGGSTPLQPSGQPGTGPQPAPYQPAPPQEDQELDPNDVMNSLNAIDQEGEGGELDPNEVMKGLNAIDTEPEPAAPQAKPAQIGPHDGPVGAPGHSPLPNWTRGFMHGMADIVDSLRNIVSSGPTGAIPGAALLQPAGAFVGSMLKNSSDMGMWENFKQSAIDVGQGMAEGKLPEMADVGNQLDMLGIPQPDKGSITGTAGWLAAQGLAMSIGTGVWAEEFLSRGAAALPRGFISTGMPKVLNANTGIMERVAQSFAQGQLKNPLMGILSELIINPLGTAAASQPAIEAAQRRGAGPVETAVSGTAAGMAGGTAVGLLTSPLLTLSRIMANAGFKTTRAGAEAILDMTDAMTGGRITKMSGGQYPWKKQPIPFVGDDILDAHRDAEMTLRAKSEGYVSAQTEIRELRNSGVPEADPKLMAAKEAAFNARYAEERALDTAEKAWGAIPAAARDKLSRVNEAIRLEAADALRPQVYADEQLAGHRQLVNDQITDALNSVRPSQPGMTTEEWATRIAEGIQRSEQTAANVERNLYKRAKVLKMPMPDAEGPRNDLYELAARAARDYDNDSIPTKEINNMHGLFSPGRQMPTLGKVRAEVSGLGQKIREEYAQPAPNNGRIALLRQLSELGNDWVANAAPDNIPLRQAREFSRFYNQLFSRSEVTPFLRTNKQGGAHVRTEDTIDALVKRPHAISDIYKMVDALKDHPVFPASAPISFEARPRGPVYSVQRLGETQTYGPGTRLPPGTDPRVPGSVASQYTTGKITPQYPPIQKANVLAGRPNDVFPTKLLNPEEQAQLAQLKSDISDGLKSRFQSELENAQAIIHHGENLDPSQIATKMQQVVSKWQPRIKEVGDAAAEMSQAMDKAMQGIQQRKAIEQSALARFMEQKEVGPAVRKLFASANPARLARALMTGEAGVGGFMEDPQAMEGFRAAVTDHFFSLTQNKPQRVLDTLKIPHINRLMNTVLGPERVSRIEQIASTVIAHERRGSETWAHAVVLASKFLALKISAMMPKIGEGAELQQAAIFSKTAEGIAKGIMANRKPEEWLAEAVRDPHVEKMLLSKMPEEALNNYKGIIGSMKENARLFRRSARMSMAMMATYQAMARSKDGPEAIDDHTPLARTARTGFSMADLSPFSSAQAAEPGGTPGTPSAITGREKEEALKESEPAAERSVPVATGAARSIMGPPPAMMGNGSRRNPMSNNQDKVNIPEDQLRNLIGEGKKYDEIASMLGVSRGAVAGRANRLGLTTGRRAGRVAGPKVEKNLMEEANEPAAAPIPKETAQQRDIRTQLGKDANYSRFRQQPSMPKLNLPPLPDEESIKAGENMFKPQRKTQGEKDEALMAGLRQRLGITPSGRRTQASKDEALMAALRARLAQEK